MKERALTFLACPLCGGGLTCEVFAGDGEVREGFLRCVRCPEGYPVIGHVPRLLPSRFYVEHAADFLTRYPALRILSSWPEESPPGQDGQVAATAASFGFEWRQFPRFGWDDPTYHADRESRTFLRKSLFRPDEFAGRFLLDAGCGNGRYTHQAARHGAEVVGMDLSLSVDAAWANAGGHPRTHIVQGDIFRPPFVSGGFDGIFSIGVLMHTGDPERAVKALAECLAPGGAMTVHVYHQGNPVYEGLDRLLRGWTTRLPADKLLVYSVRGARVAKVLERLKLLRLVNQFVRLEAHPHCVFDWYAAPVATHHTYAEVRRWLLAAGLSPTADRQKGGRIRRLVVPPKALTVRAGKLGVCGGAKQNPSEDQAAHR